MMGAMPAGLFGLNGIVAGDRQPMGPASPFKWGAGGARMTPDDLAMQQKIALQNQQAGMDTSPVGSWTQGLARVAQALVGNMQQGRVNKASAANADYEQQILQSLTGGGAANDQGTLAALSSPYLGQGTKDALKLQWTASHKAPPQPSEFERALAASGVSQDSPEWVAANKARVLNWTDPVTNITLPGNRAYVGPRSGLAALTGGGDPASPASGAPAIPTAPVGKLTPIGGGAPSQGARTFPVR